MTPRITRVTADPPPGSDEAQAPGSDVSAPVRYAPDCCVDVAAAGRPIGRVIGRLPNASRQLCGRGMGTARRRYLRQSAPLEGPTSWF